MNGLKYMVIVSVLLAVPSCFAARKIKAVPMPETEVMEEAAPEVMATPSFDYKELCRLEQPVIKAGPICTQVEESCPPSHFSICRTVRSKQDFEILGGCKKECVKCNEFGECRVVPCGDCCPRPVCRERCCPRVRRCCPRVRRCCPQ